MKRSSYNFVIGLLKSPPAYQAETSVNAAYLHQAVLESVRKEKNITMDHYTLPGKNLAITVHTEQIPGSLVQRQYVEVENTGSEALTLNALSSAFVTGIGTQGSLPWYHPDRFRLHYCLQAWEGEAQWRTSTLAEFHLIPACNHSVAAAIHFAETSSWTTCRYYPMVILEDRELKKSWFVQLEEGAGWHIEIAHLGAPYEGELCLLADNFNERFGGGKCTLLGGGENYTGTKAAFGCCDGGFEEAVKQLTIYRRFCLRRLPGKGVYPLVFNDYMNCLWANPTVTKLLPLINAASDVGCEIFCIDAGWFAKCSDNWTRALGDWIPSQDRFGADGFAGILAFIQDRGMKPGIWMELESVSPGAQIYGKVPQSWFLKQNGERIGGDARCLWDYRNPEVQEHFLKIIGELYRSGVRYIKNDYNESFVAADNHTSDRVASVQFAMKSFGEFMDKVGALYPDLILENCGSGAMRSDYGILKHFHVQSITDQETYYKLPSILMGSLAQILPEQASCWCYPCPVAFAERDIETHSFRQDWSDGEETIFNMVTGLCGVPLLSGRINLADETNLSLIREAAALYKERRSFVAAAYPVFPMGMKRIEDEQGFACLGLLDQGRLQIAVWRLKGKENRAVIPLARYGLKGKVCQIYPNQEYSTEISMENGLLTVCMEKELTARLFEIT